MAKDWIHSRGQHENSQFFFHTLRRTRTTTTTTTTTTIADLQKDYVNTSITNQIGRKYFLPQNAKNAKHQGGKSDKCPAKKSKQPRCHTLALAIFIGKIFFQNRSYAHMVDG